MPKICTWFTHHFKKSMIFYVNESAREYVPGCSNNPAWESAPTFCPYCGGKVKVIKKDKPGYPKG